MSQLNPSAASFVPQTLPSGPTYTRAELDQIGCHKAIVPPEDALFKHMMWVTRGASVGNWRQPKSTDHDWSEIRDVEIDFTTTLVLSDRTVPGDGCAHMKNVSPQIMPVIDFNHTISIQLDSAFVGVEEVKQHGPKLHADRLFLAFWMNVDAGGGSAVGGWRVMHAVLHSSN